jgi:hypothetical protein
MGPFPALTTLCNSILTGLDIPSGRLCPQLRAPSRVYAAWEFPGRKPRLLPPKTHLPRPLAAELLGFLQKNCVPRALLFSKGLARTHQSAS